MFDTCEKYSKEVWAKDSAPKTLPKCLVKLPGFCDVHVHFRQPGFEYKEDILSGSMAAARGGYTAVCTMPNLRPVPDSLEKLKLQLNAINETAVIHVYPYGSITKDEKGQELSDMEGMQDFAVGFSDDGCGVQSEELMRQAMLKAKSLGKIVAAHCEDTRYPAPESEWQEVARNIRLAKETGCALHLCHISTRKSVEYIRAAKKDGVDVTAETAPHYLIFDQETIYPIIEAEQAAAGAGGEGPLQGRTGRFKMNPPIGTAADREALIEAVQDGTIDMIATDHAPHSAEEKAKGFKESLSGIVGIETAFPLLYTELVKTGLIKMGRLIELFSTAPAKRFGIQIAKNDYSLWDLQEEYTIDPKDFLSKGKSTPFEGRKVFGACIETVCGGKTVWQREQI